MRDSYRSLTLILALVLLPGLALAGDANLYAGDNSSGTLYRLDKTTGATITSVPVTMGGNPVSAIKALAADPSSGELYAVVIDGQGPDGGGPPTSAFKLATIAPDTGIATEIGLLGDRFSGLAFADFAPTDGSPMITELVGVTGDGANTPSTLYFINTANALTSQFMTLGSGTDGEAIAWNPVDGQLYHLSGWTLSQPGDGPIELVFEKIDLGTGVITNIPISGDFFSNGNGLAYDASAGGFLFAALLEAVPDGRGVTTTELYSMTALGVATSIGPTGTHFAGMAFSDLVPVELQSFSIE